MPQTIYVSATPAAYEHQHASHIVEQIIRPTGLIDPEIIVAPVTAKNSGEKSQVDDLIARIPEVVKRKERVMVTTLTKKMAEDLTDYLTQEKQIKAVYLHSGVETLDRIRILTEYRKGSFDVLVGVNLLREGLDLPEVSLVAILDADKEGFLRSETSLIQTIGRAARNVRGRVVLYADQMTGSLRNAIRETERRREIQLAYNKKHGITPKTIKKKIQDITEGIMRNKEFDAAKKALALEESVEGRPLEEVIREKETQMREAANNLQFELAAIIRDEIRILKTKSKVPAKPQPLIPKPS
jgi:excinuclease ABC subunit B